MPRRVPSRRRRGRLSPLVPAALAILAVPASPSRPALAQEPAPPDPDAPVFRHDMPGPRYDEVLIRPGTESGLPRVVPNDNRRAAGRVENGVRVVDLEVVRADWRVESDAGPGLRVAAVGEVGGAPAIPAPLIRAESGTRIRVRLRNGVEGPLQVWGLHDRPADDAPPFTVPAGETVEVEFEAGPPGTYLYHMWEGPDPTALPDTVPFPEREQLAGALVVDAPGEAREDRILVINIFGEPTSERVHPNGYLEGVAINGRTWPFTELLEMEVGRTENWRVVNASNREHPMHLHGFYFQVKSRGTPGVDTVYAARDERLVVTESMLPRTTMRVAWTPTRPGRWIFHCHLTFHVTNAIRLPGAAEADPEHAHSHMSGLVMGIDVAPGPSDLIARGEPVQVELHAKTYGDTLGTRYGFDLAHGPPAPDEVDTPGPLLIFHQYQAVDITVHNELDQPTGVHWHGLELDAWSDGVPGWSASDGRMSPAIRPDDSFTYRLSLMRPGTFMYHTHLNDIDQLTGGLYGPLLVLPEGETFDPVHDHPRIFGWTNPGAQEVADLELNGRAGEPDAETTVGETHRFRIMNIAPAGMIAAWVMRDGAPVPIRLHAKDGADLPEHQRVEVPELPRIGVGETADFLWTPVEPGEYTVWIGYGPVPDAGFKQTWTVRAGG